MDLSIIIPSYNTKELLARCVDAIEATLKDSEIRYEVLVIDNGSTDGTREMLEKSYKRVQKVFNKHNLGFGASNNLGISKVKGEYVLLLNSDTEVRVGSVARLLAACRASRRTFVGPKLLNTDGSPQASAGPEYGLLTVGLMLFGKGDRLGLTRYSPDHEREVDWVSGACVMGRRQDFVAIGFDEEIFMYMDEIDFFHRARAAGYQVRFIADAVVVHVGAASSGSRKDPVGQIYRGLLYYYRKHYNKESQQLVRAMLVVKARLALMAGRLLRNRDLSHTYAHALGLVS